MILVSLCVIVPLLLGGWIFAGPKTIRELYVNYDCKKESFNYNIGESIWLYGKITGIKYYNITWGNYSLLTLDGTSRICENDIGVFVPTKSLYHVGNTLSITLHFMKYHFNNDSFISAPELFTPLYSTVFNYERIIDDIGGITLVPMPTTGAMEFTIYFPMDSQRTGYPLNLFSIMLGKGSHYGGEDFMDLQQVSKGGGANYAGGLIDEKDNLSGPSKNGMIEFKDVVNPGMLDSGDELIVHIPPTTNKYKLDSYVLSFKSTPYLAGGAHYFVNGYRGVLEYTSGLLQDHVQVSLMNETRVGNKWQTTFQIVDVPRILAPYHHEFKWYTIDVSNSAITFCKNTITDGVICAGPNDVTYHDVNHNGIVDPPDDIVINQTSIDELNLGFFNNEGRIGSIFWINGVGVSNGGGPFIEYHTTKALPNNVSINLDKLYGYPGIRLTNITEHRQFRAELFENNTEVINYTVVNGTIGQANKTSLSFIDHDFNGYLNVGDQFNVRCLPSTEYKLRLVSETNRYVPELTWRT